MMKQRKFVLRIRDQVADLYLIQGSEITDSWVLDPTSSPPTALLKHPKDPINILVDTTIMHLESETLPALNPLDLLRLKQVKNHQFSESLPLYGSRVFREGKHWQMIKLGFGDEFHPWRQWLEVLENPVGCISSLAYESVFILKKLRNQPQWQMLLTLHEGNHIRMSVFNGQHLELTRYLPLEMKAAPQELAHDILKPLESTLQYIIRKHPEAGEKINVFAVTDEETRKFLKPSFLAPHQFQTLTPYQLATRLGLHGKVPFRLSDTLLIRALSRRWVRSLPLKSPSLQSTSISLPFSLTRKKILMGCGALVAFLILDKGIQIMTTSQRLASLKAQHLALQRETDAYQKDLIP